MQFDLVTTIGLGVLAYAVILLYRHYRGGVAGEEDDVAVGQRQDVLQAIKSMRNDRKS